MRINDVLFEFAPAGGGDSGNYFQALASAWYNGTFDTGSLQKGIKSQQDVERLLNRGIVCPDGKTRKLHIDYNSDFDGVEIYSDDYYEYGDHDDTIDSRTGQKWGPYDFMAFSDEDLSEGVSEGVRTESAELAKQYGWAYNQGEYGASMTHPKHGRISLSSPVTSRSGDTAVEREWTHNNASGIGDRSLAQHLQSLKEQGVAEGSLNEFAADDGDSGGEDDALRNYARMWWAGDEATQMQIERALAQMGWEIGEDEGGYDNGGVFVVRAGDENGNSYQSWAAEDLTEDGALNNYRSRIGTQGNIQRQNQRQQDWLDAHHQSSLDRMTNHRDAMNRLSNAGVDDTIARQEIRRERMRKDDDDWDNTFDVMRDRLNRYQWSSQKDNAEQGDLNEKSTSQAQFRTMAAAAHNPEFAKKVGIKQSVAREFHGADRDQDYKDLPKKADEGATVTTTPGSIEPGGAVDNFKQQMANNTELAYQKGMAEDNKKSEPPEADYGDDYQDMVKRVKKLAGLGPLKTQYDPAKRVYRNIPTAVQPKK